MNTGNCDMCGNYRQVRPTLVDDNYEADICAPCRRDLRNAGEKVDLLPTN